MRLVFMGTRDIAIPVLRALLERRDDRHTLAAVFTQPDRPAGRKNELAPPPVKAMAQAAAVPVFQPESLRDEATVAALRDLAPDVGVVASYAQLLPRSVLQIPRHGWLNVHPSLLPRHRGPSPVAAAILAGDTQTGVTIIKLVRAMDAGPIVDQVQTPVLPDDTTAALIVRLGELGAVRLVAALDDWVSGKIVAIPQDESQATYSQLLRRDDGRIDWHLPASEIVKRLRAFTPWPGIFTTWQGKHLVILLATAQSPSDSSVYPSPGRVLDLVRADDSDGLRVATAHDTLVVKRLQLEGRRALDAAEFVRGYPAILGAQLE